MKQEDFERQAHEASKAMLKKKAPTKPETQFMKGALWAWQLLKSAHDTIYYEDVLRQDVCDRYGITEPERWQESLIAETADMMAERDEMQDEIRETGRLLVKYDKQMQPYKESNPLYVHLKELQRSIGMQREHLGLSIKSTKKRDDTKKGVDDEDPMANYYKNRK